MNFWRIARVSIVFLSFIVSQANATVLYNLSSSAYSFEYDSSVFITSTLDVPSSNLSMNTDVNGSITSIDFLPTTCNVGLTPCDGIYVNYFTNGAGTAAFYFPDGALGADGTYIR